MRALAASLLLAIAACGPMPLPVAPPSAPRTSPPPAPPPVVEAPSLPPPPPAPVRWGLVYRRACVASLVSPVVSSDGASVSSCGARFDLAGGRFDGPAPAGLLALLPGDRALVDPHQQGGFDLLDPPRPDVHAAGGTPNALAVSTDGARVVSLERHDEQRSLVVRRLPSLEVVRATSLGSGFDGRGLVGFLADGREVLAAPYACAVVACSPARRQQRGEGASCPELKCESEALLVVDQGAPRLLDPRLAGLRGAALTAGGERAAIVRTDGSAALVALPSGETVATLPEQGDEALEALAVSPGGDRVAVAAKGHLHVYARAGSGFLEVLDDKQSATSLVFTADGRTLLAGDALAVYREGAEPRKAPAMSYEVTLPAGFERLVERSGSMVFAKGGGREWSMREGLVAMFANARHGASVTVVALDADEIASDGDVATWGRKVAARLLPYATFDKAKDHDAATLDAWGEPGSRSVELHYVGRGCEDIDNYYRVAERDGALHEVHLVIEGELGKKRVTPWLRAFLDAPFGVAPRRGEAAPAEPNRKHPRKKKASK